MYVEIPFSDLAIISSEPFGEVIGGHFTISFLNVEQLLTNNKLTPKNLY
jgi:hypothetical protein